MEHDRILGYFLEEAVEHLNTIEQGLLNLPETVKQPAMIRELFRAAHSIKGSAAMLGLADVQKVGNQFEANFKLLKEQPQIAVDKQLQSLFLESFRFLRAGIEEVRVSKDPYRQDPNTPDPIGDPVFEELKSYLQQLLSTTEPTVATVHSQNPARDALEQVFGEYVTRKLAEITSLCSQPDRPDIRTQIQQICQKLGNLGENFEFLEWTNLFTACRLATANPANHLPKLGATIKIAIKQAQILVLADRHQAISITPDLVDAIDPRNSADQLVPESIGTWGLDDIASIDLNLGTTTQKLIGRDNHPIILQQQQPVAVSSISSSGGSFNFDDSDLFADRATFSELAVDADESELNEFMNLLSDDMPTEGTWMDDDFFGQELPLKDLNDSMFLQPNTAIADLVADDPKPITIDYDKETFYSPDFEGINESEIPNFWSDTKLAAAQHQPIDLGLDLNPTDRQFQPELGSNLDLNFSAPDFGLDRPMSQLFPTVAAPENWPEVADPLLTDLTAVEHQFEPNDFQIDLPSAVEAATIVEHPIDSFEPQLVDDLVPSTGDGNLSTSDILLFEELGDHQSPAALVEPESQNASNEDQLSDELGDWIDLAIYQNQLNQNPIDDLQGLDLDILNDIEAGITASIDNDLADFNFDAFGAASLIETPVIIDNPVEAEITPSIGASFDDFNLEQIGDDRSTETGGMTTDFADLGLDSDLSLDPPSTGFGDFSELDFDLGDISSDIASQELTDLGDILGELPESNLAEMDDFDALFSGEQICSDASGATFDDLDALMIDSEPTAALESNFDDLDALM
ncbi:MAG: Hpt domain-containing protein, partial [Chamaesiphon sp.]|nr:Hpt domain-containing protein [Chamaesiphon sp.]